MLHFVSNFIYGKIWAKVRMEGADMYVCKYNGSWVYLYWWFFLSLSVCEAALLHLSTVSLFLCFGVLSPSSSFIITLYLNEKKKTHLHCSFSLSKTYLSW